MLRVNGTGIHRSAKWLSKGVTVAGGKAEGERVDQLWGPCGVYVDDDQTVYVADQYNHRIIAWKANGTIAQVVAGGNGKGDGAHQLNEPHDVIVDKERESLIICDRANRRVIRWALRHGTSGETIVSDTDCHGLAMDERGFLYVVNHEKGEVRRYKIGDNEGTVVAGGNSYGDSLDQLSQPQYVAVDQHHAVYVSDWMNHRVIKWNEGAKQGIVVAGGHGAGHGLQQLHYPLGIAVDQSGAVFVADCANHRVVRWSQGAKQGAVVAGGNGEGAKPAQLNQPYGLVLDRHDNIYTVDTINARVQKFNIEQATRK